MRRLLPPLATPTVLLYIFVMFKQVATGIYLAGGLEAPGLLRVAYPLGFLWVLGWWLRSDCRKREIRWVFDMGLFLFVAWPLVLPYYLLKTRGARGLLVILGFVGVYFGAAGVGMVLYLILAPPG